MTIPSLTMKQWNETLLCCHDKTKALLYIQSLICDWEKSRSSQQNNLIPHTFNSESYLNCLWLDDPLTAVCLDSICPQFKRKCRQAPQIACSSCSPVPTLLTPFTFLLHLFLHPSIYPPEIPIIFSLSLSLFPSDDPLCINPISRYLPQTNSITQAFLPTTYQFMEQTTPTPKTSITPSGHR